MHKSYKRSQRVSALLKRELSRIIRQKLKDPGIGEMSISKVLVTDDLRLAKVYFTSLDDEDARQRSLRALEHAKGFIRGKLGECLTIKFTPELRFYYDNSFDRADKIDSLLQRIRNEGQT